MSDDAYEVMGRKGGGFILLRQAIYHQQNERVGFLEESRRDRIKKLNLKTKTGGCHKCIK